jgi:NAD(P)-dependent dehydrogenase (short-subunit alcohol dehydrogenase family)
MAATGARVFLAVRSLEKGRTACSSFLEPGRVELLQLDTSSLASVRAAAATLLAKSSTLNGLICNAGIMAVPNREETVDGFESQLGTNYLGHFLLFWLLKDALLKASTPAFNSRLVNVSSSGHHATEIHFDDFNLSKEGEYEPNKAYGQSKLAQIYMANYIDRRFGPSGLHALSLMPGGIMTNLQQHLAPEIKNGWQAIPEISNIIKTPEQGAATTVVAALSKEWEGRGGKYLEDCGIAPFEPLVPGMKGVKDYAYDEGKETRLWEHTLKVLELKDE